MGNLFTGILTSVRQKRSLKHWQDMEGLAARTSLENLRSVRNMARQLRQRVNTVVHIADMRLALPVIGSNGIDVPLGSDWSHRPAAWSGPIFPAGHAPARNNARLGDSLTMYHDCKSPSVTVRQFRNTQVNDLAPFGIALDVFNFDGSFLSLVLQAPPEALAGLSKRHVLRVAVKASSERPMDMIARLNLKHGPNTEQVSQPLDLSLAQPATEFDLAYVPFNENKLEQIWIDLFFESPSMNRVEIRDFTLSRHTRAEL